MKFVIQSQKDLRFLQGKYVLQVNSDKPDTNLGDMDWGFAKEKRLYLVIGLGFADLYGNYREYKTFEAFKNMFNLYKTPEMREEFAGRRFHRLLTSIEIRFLAERLIEDNY